LLGIGANEAREAMSAFFARNSAATNVSHMQQTRRIRGKKMAVVRPLRAGGNQRQKTFHDVAIVERDARTVSRRID
jgi:hypothetical protein